MPASVAFTPDVQGVASGMPDVRHALRAQSGFHGSGWRL
jgi:hypothetical protein